MLESGSILGLTLWILLTAQINRTAASCKTKVPEAQYTTVSDSCHKYLIHTLNGYHLDRESSFPQHYTTDQIKNIIGDTTDTHICNFTKVDTVMKDVCCVGYTGTNCDQYLCTPDCVHGYCSNPNTCTCDAGYGGSACDLDVVDEVALDQYCFEDNMCVDLKGGSSTLVSKSDCCDVIGGTSWGNGLESCIACQENDDSAGPIIEQTNKLSFRTCRSFSSVLYRTYDGLQFTFPGQCTYILSKFGDHFTITSQVINGDSFQNMRKKITIHIKASPPIELESGVAIFDGSPVALSSEQEVSLGSTGCKLLKVGDWIRADCGGFRVKVDEQSTVAISIEKQELNNVDSSGELTGMCGNYNEDASDDMVTKAGDVTSSPIVFGQSWKTVTNDECPNVQTFPSYCSQVNDSIAVDARSRCNVIRDRYVFEDCYTYTDVNYWANLCENFVCEAGTEDEKEAARCGVIEEFATRCREANIIVNWRHSFLCPRSCPQNMVYKEFTSECQYTCTSMHSVFDYECYERRTSGCVCDTGYVLQQGVCVRIQECKCLYKRNYYETGTSIRVGCKSCECNVGKWVCQSDVCSSTCDIAGVGHVMTFDDLKYSYEPSACKYTLLEMSDGTNDFTVEMDHESCGEFLNRNCPSGITVQYKTTKIILQKTKDVLVHEDSSTVKLVTLPYLSRDVQVKHITSSFIEVKVLGASILWDSDSQVSIRLEPTYSGIIRGLCGNMNYNSLDEWISRQNADEVNEVDFAYGYVDGECPNAAKKQLVLCDENTDAHSQAVATCDIIKQSLFQDIREENHELVRFYYDSCVQDMCAVQNYNDKNAMCRMVLALARQCAKYNISIDVTADSNITADCGQYFVCSFGEYTSCADKCSGSCRDLQFPHPGCTAECIPGCTCTNGNVKDENNLCVDIADCTCVDEYSPTEEFYEAGRSIYRQCGECVCANASWVCDEDNCEEQIICPENQEKMIGQSTTPRTCSNPNPTTSPTYYVTCGCSNGLYMTETGTCVTHENCPCQIGSEFKNQGEIITQGCLKLQCTFDGAPKWQVVEKVNCPAVCFTSGDVHYVSFDGKYYSFEGSCKYVLVKSKLSSTTNFEIHVQNTKCGSTDVTCAKNIEILINGNVVAKLLRGTDLQVVNITRTDNTYSSKGMVIKQQSFWTIVYLDNGISVVWDGGTRVYVYASEDHKNKVEGLCGNYDDSDQNDFELDNEVSNTVDTLANAYKVDQQCEDVLPADVTPEPCDASDKRRSWSEDSCAIINTGSTFQECRDKMNSQQVKEYYDACLYDACSCDSGGDCECLCTAISNFAEACNRIDVIVEWRHQRLCPIMCEHGEEYNGCAPTCPDRCNYAQTADNYCDDTRCHEGCACTEGFVLENNRCIPVSYCPCIIDDTLYSPGSVVLRNCQNCTCVNGIFNCTGEECAETCEDDDEFLCADLTCINKTMLCDGSFDCLNDELNCEGNYTCPPNTFECEPGHCIDIDQLCDGSRDCIGGIDEENCAGNCTQFLCDNGKCILGQFRCDGHYDCGNDTSDERNCNVTGPCTGIRDYRCSTGVFTGECLPITHYCDGHDDCGDGSDEVDCNNCTCENSFTCVDNCTCISEYQRCDGIPNCGDGSDEEGCLCDDFTCSDGNQCVNGSNVCDGIYDCNDMSDEADCATTTGITTVPSTTELTTVGTTTTGSTTGSTTTRLTTTGSTTTGPPTTTEPTTIIRTSTGPTTTGPTTTGPTPTGPTTTTGITSTGPITTISTSIVPTTAGPLTTTGGGPTTAGTTGGPTTKGPSTTGASTTATGPTTTVPTTTGPATSTRGTPSSTVSSTTVPSTTGPTTTGTTPAGPTTTVPTTTTVYECPDEMEEVNIGVGADGQSAGDASTPSGYTWNTTDNTNLPSLDVDVNNIYPYSYFTQIEFDILGAETVDIEVNNETKPHNVLPSGDTVLIYIIDQVDSFSVLITPATNTEEVIVSNMTVHVCSTITPMTTTEEITQTTTTAVLSTSTVEQTTTTIAYLASSSVTSVPGSSTVCDYHCADGEKCIDPSQVCDGTFDCNDMSDEENCGTGITTQVSTTPYCVYKSCKPTDYIPCYEQSEECDGQIHCEPSGIDETSDLCNITTTVSTILTSTTDTCIDDMYDEAFTIWKVA